MEASNISNFLNSLLGKGIDEFDLRLIELLCKNPRATYAELSSGVGLSRDAVKYRLAKLLENGKLKLGIGFGSKQLGLNRCLVNVAFLKPSEEIANRFISELKGLVENAYKTSGNWDVSFVLLYQDNEHLNGVLQHLKGIAEIRTLEVNPIVD